jgi:hypothetical protein
MLSPGRLRKQGEIAGRHTASLAVCRQALGMMVRPNRCLVMYPPRSWHDDERCDHPSQIGPVGSFGSAELPMWCGVDIYDWAKPSRSPIFDMFVSNFLGLHRRAGLQRHDRPTVARRYFHQTRLGNRCNRWSLRALQRACARSCSTSPSTRYYQLTIMGGAAYPRALSTRDLRGRGVAHVRPTGKPTAEGSEIMTWAGRPASLACGGDRPLKR